MFDSVFSPLLTYSFESDRPEIPVERITVALDGVEEAIANRQGQLIENAVDDLIRRATPLLQRGDLSGIAALESSVGIALQQPIFEAWERAYTLGSAHGIAEMVSAAPDLDILFGPLTIRNTPAEQAVLARVIELAGNFSDDAINRLKGDLISSIIPNPETGKPISRRELRSRIRTTLNVADSRAEMIARTESTTAYNTGRVSTYNQSDAVDALRYLAIMDSRTTEICRSRNGMVVPKDDTETIEANSPANHVRCRASWSPVLSRFNARHREMLNDPARSPQNMQLAPLPRGWRTGGLVEVEPAVSGVEQAPPHPDYPEVPLEEGLRFLGTDDLIELGSGVSGTSYLDPETNTVVKAGFLRGGQEIPNHLTEEVFTIVVDEIGNLQQANQLGFGPRLVSASTIDASGIGVMRMERVNGIDLDDAINDGLVSRDQAKMLGGSLIDDLVRLADAGAIHGDLHASNVIFDPETSEYTIIDWATARFSQPHVDRSIDIDVLGPVAYVLSEDGIESLFSDLEANAITIDEFYLKARKFFAPVEAPRLEEQSGAVGPTLEAEQFNHHAIPDLKDEDFRGYLRDKRTIGIQDDPNEVHNQSFDEWKNDPNNDSVRKTKGEYKSQLTDALNGGFELSEAAIADGKLTKAQVRQNEENAETMNVRRESVTPIDRAVNEPLMSDEDAAGYKPSMTREEAEAYLGDSFMKDVDFFHGNQAWVTQDVRNDGAKPELNADGIYGQGFYMGSSRDIGEMYASAASSGNVQDTEVLTGRVKVRNPFVATEAEMTRLAKSFPGGQSNGSDSEAVTNFLRAKGYDSVYVKDLGYVSAFDGRQVVIIDVEESSAGSEAQRRHDETHRRIIDNDGMREVPRRSEFGEFLTDQPSSEPDAVYTEPDEEDFFDDDDFF